MEWNRLYMYVYVSINDIPEARWRQKNTSCRHRKWWASGDSGLGFHWFLDLVVPFWSCNDELRRWMNELTQNIKLSKGLIEEGMKERKNYNGKRGRWVASEEGKRRSSKLQLRLLMFVSFVTEKGGSTQV